jgi:hypothetical protein
METTGKLTKETFTALLHTSRGLLDIVNYCTRDLGARYVLLGKFQTDSLEARFGQYRQLAGGQYDVSLRQIFECEKKIRMLSVLKLKLNGRDLELRDFSFDWDAMESTEACEIVFDSITEEEFCSLNDVLPVITYLAGYCSFKVVKKLKCDDCKSALTCPAGNVCDIENSYISGITRGRLLYPSIDVIRIVSISYLLLQKLCSESAFQRATCQRQIAVKLILDYVSDDDDLSFMKEPPCVNGHDQIKILKMIVWATTNSILNNYCKLQNDKVSSNKRSKRRKLETLT